MCNSTLVTVYSFAAHNIMCGNLKQLTELRESYEGYVPMEYDVYLKNMAKYAIRNSLLLCWRKFGAGLSFYFWGNDIDWALLGCRVGEWGDHVTLQAAADYVGRFFTALQTQSLYFTLFKFSQDRVAIRGRQTQTARECRSLK